jgi:hypothetical protein
MHEPIDLLTRLCLQFSIRVTYPVKGKRKSQIHEKEALLILILIQPEASSIFKPVDY